jgi:predicted ArsR family transcriptional regulator
MESTALIRLLNNHQQEGFDALYKSYSDQVFRYIHHIVNDRPLAIRLLNETFSKIRHETPVINHNTGSVFTWLIEETIQVILENCPEKHGEVRRQIICETHLLNITENGNADQFSIHHLVSTYDDYLRRSA